MRETQDHYFREAKREGYRSRAAYKLIEIDDKRRILARGDRVLDCGCAPGSWLQVAAARVGPKGSVLGVDLQDVPTHDLPDNVRAITGDLGEVDDPALGGAAFDVVLSDMAPNTTGVRDIDHHASVRLCEVVLGRVRDLLRPGGNLVMKVFEGEAYPALIEQIKPAFGQVKGFRPKASRSVSTEMFLIATGFRPDAIAAAPARAPARKRPSTGWS